MRIILNAKISTSFKDVSDKIKFLAWESNQSVSSYVKNLIKDYISLSENERGVYDLHAVCTRQAKGYPVNFTLSESEEKLVYDFSLSHQAELSSLMGEYNKNYPQGIPQRSLDRFFLTLVLSTILEDKIKDINETSFQKFLINLEAEKKLKSIEEDNLKQTMFDLENEEEELDEDPEEDIPEMRENKIISSHQQVYNPSQQQVTDPSILLDVIKELRLQNTELLQTISKLTQTICELSNIRKGNSDENRKY